MSRPGSSAASRAGFRSGDVVLSWAGRPVHDVDDCEAPGPAVVVVLRDGEKRELLLPAGRHGVVVDRQYHEAGR